MTMKYLAGALTLVALLAACGSEAAGPEDGPRLVRVFPEGRLLDLDASVALEFSRPMMPGEEGRVSLLRADGSTVAVTSMWSDDGRTLLLDPNDPLEAATTYTIHVVGGMHDRDHTPMRMDRGMMRGVDMSEEECPMDSTQHASHDAMHQGGMEHQGDMPGGDDHAAHHGDDGGGPMMDETMSHDAGDECIAFVFTTA